VHAAEHTQQCKQDYKDRVTERTWDALNAGENAFDWVDEDDEEEDEEADALSSPPLRYGASQTLVRSVQPGYYSSGDSLRYRASETRASPARAAAASPPRSPPPQQQQSRRFDSTADTHTYTYTDDGPLQSMFYDSDDDLGDDYVRSWRRHKQRQQQESSSSSSITMHTTRHARSPSPTRPLGLTHTVATTAAAGLPSARPRPSMQDGSAGGGGGGGGGGARADAATPSSADRAAAARARVAARVAEAAALGAWRGPPPSARPR
jgi:hypothetical protein